MSSTTVSPLVTPVILCGGYGTRLWPLSRSGFPEQFLVLSDQDSNRSLFQQAIARINAIGNQHIELGETLIVTNEEHRFLALDQIAEVLALTSTPCSFLLEPQSKNTALALTLAALAASESGNDPLLVATPANQTITNQDVFTVALQKAIRISREDKIVILKIGPTKAETGYGYIQVDQQKADGSCGVLAFTKKPNQETALQYLKEGNYFWNSGLFVLKASLWLKVLEQFWGDIATAVEKSWHKGQIDQMQ